MASVEEPTVAVVAQPIVEESVVVDTMEKRIRIDKHTKHMESLSLCILFAIVSTMADSYTIGCATTTMVGSSTEAMGLK